MIGKGIGVHQRTTLSCNHTYTNHKRSENFCPMHQNQKETVVFKKGMKIVAIIE
jgi:hypothetical protein